MTDKFERVLILNFPKIALEAPPMAPALLAELCNQHNVQYKIIDCNLEFHQQLDNELKEEILELYAEGHIESLSNKGHIWLTNYYEKLAIECKDYDLIAISIFSKHSVQLTYDFLKQCQQTIDAKIVIGGAGSAGRYAFEDNNYELVYQYLNAKNLIDYWILGEGDVAFVELLYKNFNETINNVEFNQLQDFSKVPVPNFDSFNLHDYMYMGKKLVSVEGSRGCVRKCTFCDIHETWGRFKFKKGQDLANELVSLYNKYDVDHFWFNDSLINGSLTAYREFIHALAEFNDNRFTWSSQAIIRSKRDTDEQDFQALKASGCETLAVGLESFSQDIRFHMRKKFTDDDVEQFFNLAQKYDIKLFLLMIVGYPTETRRDIDITLKQLDKYQHLADDGTISGLRIGGTMTIGPGMPIYNMQDELGVKYVDVKTLINPAVQWQVGENNLETRVDWHTEISDYARRLGYNCADPEMSIEETMLHFLNLAE